MDSKDAKEILNAVNSIKVELAKFTERQDQHRKEIDAVTKKVEVHEKNQNKFFGFISLLGMGATAFFSWLFKNI